MSLRCDDAKYSTKGDNFRAVGKFDEFENLALGKFSKFLPE